MTDVLPDPSANQALAVVAPVKSEGNALVAYTSIRGNDDETELRILNAISDAMPIQEHLNEEILVKDILILNTTVTDRNTGEIVEAQRTVIVTPDGTAYAAMSGGIIRSLNNLIAVKGEPSGWRKPVPVRVTEAGPKGRQYYTLKFGPANAKGK